MEQKITATELDMTSPSFASFYNANTGTGGRYYDCYRWLPVRGIAVSPCPAGTSFTATTYAGRSHFERLVISAVLRAFEVLCDADRRSPAIYFSLPVASLANLLVSRHMTSFKCPSFEG